MNALFSASYLLVCALLATELTRVFTRQPVSNENVSGFLAWVVVFFAVFFCGFYILGYVNLATNLPTVNPAYGCVIVLIALVGFRLWFAKRMPGLLDFKRDAIYLQNPLRISLPGTGL